MIDERLEEQAALYALGSLSPEETRAFQEALGQDAELRNLVADLLAATDALAGTVPLINPPPALKQKILAQIDGGQKIVSLPGQTPARGPSAWLPWALAAGLAILCSVFVSRENSLRTRMQELTQLAATLQSATNDLQQTVAALNETNRIANLRVAVLDSLVADQPKAVAVSLWDEKNQTGVFVVQNLKPPAKDKDYQLWVIDPKYATPVDAGVFQVNAQGGVRYEFKAGLPIQTAGKFAVTLEDKGGSAVPKGKMVLIGG